MLRSIFLQPQIIIKEIRVMAKFLVLAAVLLSACSAGQQAANGGGNYKWIGCHIVHTNPASCYSGSNIGPLEAMQCKVYAFGPGGDLPVGEKIFFKQLKKGENRHDTKVDVMTARPCEEGE